MPRHSSIHLRFMCECSRLPVCSQETPMLRLKDRSVSGATTGALHAVPQPRGVLLRSRQVPSLVHPDLEKYTASGKIVECRRTLSRFPRHPEGAVCFLGVTM